MFNSTCRKHGQFVIYYNFRPQNNQITRGLSVQAFSELCEVEVYGCSETGYYGPDCSESCPDANCRYCHIETGDCQGCYPGYQGDRCNKECDGNRYGQDCGQTCGACLGYKQCHHISGSCPEGCDVGYEGNFCEIACSNGKFGRNCEQNCSRNCAFPNMCNGTSGECERGCQPGWQGSQCNYKCVGGTYGANCSERCGNCLLQSNCHHVNGTCLNGCSEGYQGIMCIDDCGPYNYGFDCMHNCSAECINETCDSKTGDCAGLQKSTPQKKGDDILIPVIGGVLGVVVASMIILTVVLLIRRQGGRSSTKYEADNAPPDHVNKGKAPKKNRETVFSGIDSKPSSSGNQGKNYENVPNEKPILSPKTSQDLDEDELIHLENPYGDFYANETVTEDIHLNELESVIAEKKKNEDDGFQKEYATLPYGEKYRCDAGKKDENMVKNRFKTTFPYDHSRVILKTGTGSDYINANYITGARKDNEYIAAQGPRQNTVADFWAMIWQEHVSTIVMLTNLKEGNKTKCTQYWPHANNNIDDGTFSVNIIEEKVYSFYIVRKMSLIHKRTNKSRVVTQFHYTAWPDHGTPDPLCLVVFLDHVTRTGTNQNCPTLVHCSAGIGRTGTYIAIDVLNKIGRKTGKVNIAEYVRKMRENRMNMVQTYEQYMTIFLALNEIFKSPVNTITVADFIKNVDTISIDKPANQNTLRKEFQTLMKIRPVYTDCDYKLAIQSIGEAHSIGILPLDKYSIHLPSNVPKRGSFINAICLPSFINSKALIVTHYPPTEDAVDFLRLLNDHESDTVICMDPLKEVGSSASWFPSPSSSKSVPPYTVHWQSKSNTEVKSTNIHVLQNKSEDEVHSVTVIEPKVGIKISGKPLDTFQIRNLVVAALNVKTENPITIVSSNGAYLCGVFCAVHNVIQQINTDDCIDIFTVVRQLQVRRPEFFSSFDEYSFAVKCVYDYIQSTTENIYCNQ